MPDHDPQTPDEGATILGFPSGQESPRTSEVRIDGEPVTVIYLPWRHEVDGGHRPAGLYYHAQDTSGFYPDPGSRGLDAVLEEVRPFLGRHLRLVRAEGENPPPT